MQGARRCRPRIRQGDRSEAIRDRAAAESRKRVSGRGALRDLRQENMLSEPLIVFGYARTQR